MKTATTKKTTATTKKAATLDFGSILEGTDIDITSASNLVKELEEKLSAAKKDLEAKKRLRNYYRKILAMTKWTDKPYTWNCRKIEGSNYQHTAWTECYTFKTATYELTVDIKERTDLKKMKWEVTLRGQKLEITDEMYYSYKPGDGVNDSYRDYDYLKKAYMNYHYNSNTDNWVCEVDPEKGGLVLEQKFNSEDKARAWAKEWMERLVKDHKETIDHEKKLIRAAEAAKKGIEDKFAAKEAAEAKIAAEFKAKLEKIKAERLKAKAETAMASK